MYYNMWCWLSVLHHIISYKGASVFQVALGSWTYFLLSYYSCPLAYIIFRWQLYSQLECVYMGKADMSPTTGTKSALSDKGACHPSKDYSCSDTVYHEKIACLKRLWLRILRHVHKLFLMQNFYTYTCRCKRDVHTQSLEHNLNKITLLARFYWRNCFVIYGSWRIMTT